MLDQWRMDRGSGVPDHTDHHLESYYPSAHTLELLRHSYYHPYCVQALYTAVRKGAESRDRGY